MAVWSTVSGGSSGVFSAIPTGRNIPWEQFKLREITNSHEFAPAIVFAAINIVEFIWKASFDLESNHVAATRKV